MSGDRNMLYKLFTLVNLRDRIKLGDDLKKIIYTKNDSLC